MWLMENEQKKYISVGIEMVHSRFLIKMWLWFVTSLYSARWVKMLSGRSAASRQDHRTHQLTPRFRVITLDPNKAIVCESSIDMFL